jgi:16S rRNA (adenine1518-N6/adenine1519-N6)-dimethyltransferase
VDAINPQPSDVVLEIGPGKGSLTARLASRVGAVVAIEKDRDLVHDLRERGTGKGETLPGNVTVLEGDALDLDWRRVLADAACPVSPVPFPAFKVIGNLPYYITSPLIDKALEPPLPRVAVFLVQREVAERIGAAPATRAYGALSVGVQVLARPERLFLVKAGAFNPPPKVDSAVVRLTPLAEPLVAEEERREFRAFVVALFGRRRQQIGRSLRELEGCSREQVADVLATLSLDPASRVEVLAPSVLVRLFRVVHPR